MDYRSAEKIQEKINPIQQIPDSAKVEINKKDLKDIASFLDENSFNGYSMQNNTLLTGARSKQNRKEYYETYDSMDETNFIHRGLNVISYDCSNRNEEGNVYKINSDDDDNKQIIDNLFKRINLNEELESVIFETCKYGDNFYEVIPDDYKKPTMISRIRYLEPDRVNRIEKNGKLVFYTYWADATDPEESAFQINDKKEDQKIIYKLEPWQIIHFRIPSKKFYPYGGSLLYSGVRTFKQLSLLEDGMVIYRIARVPERRVFKIDVGNLPQSEANRQVQKIASNYRTTQIMDDKGNINRTASALAVTQDIFIPVRDGGKGTDITSLGPGTALNNIDDIRYFRDQILWTMNIPPEKMGFTSDQAGASSGRGSLAMNDINFSRFCQRVQYDIEKGLTKLASIELFFQKRKKSELNNFKIELTTPSNIKEIMDIEFLTQKMNLIQSMLSTGLFSKKFILKYVMRMSKKEIDDLLFFKDIENGQGQQDNANVAGGIGGMMDTSAMGAAAPMGGEMDTSATGMMPSNGTALSSTNTEISEKMIKLFGKDILIEHKEDFVKLMKAQADYENSMNKEDNETIEEQASDMTNYLSELFASESNKHHATTNSLAQSLINENELCGLDFNKHELNVYERKTRTGPKGASGSNIIFEEKHSKVFGY